MNAAVSLQLPFSSAREPSIVIARTPAFLLLLLMLVLFTYDHGLVILPHLSRSGRGLTFLS